MIRSATSFDSEYIANMLWNNWCQLKLRQIPTPQHKYASAEALGIEIRQHLDRWFVCESPDSKPNGFFCLCEVSHSQNKTYKRWGFPQQFVQIEYFACLNTGEILLPQFQLLVSELKQQSVLLVIPSSLRDAYWAVLKAGFRQLGDCSMIVGSFVWLYLDRENRHDAIQTRLRKEKVVA